MSKNDYIAEYVKERYPEIINTLDFALWQMKKAINDSCQKAFESFAAIDFSGLSKALKEMKKQRESERKTDGLNSGHIFIDDLCATNQKEQEGEG